MTRAESTPFRFRPRPTRQRAVLSRFARNAIALAVCAAMEPAFAQVGANTLPTGPRVNAGQASVTTAGNRMTVNQTTPKVSLGWQSFSIGARASVVFAQPSSSSVALNRVLGNNPSWIFGQLSANGHVFLINPAGVVFAPGARLNVGAIVASTLNMSDQDFMAGRYVFSGDSTASVVNRGSIITSPGGYAALFGANVSNEGTIVAPSGTVAMGAGSRVVMDLAGDGLLSVSVDAASARAMASNTGLIQADGGRVIVSARAADALAGTVLNQTGIIEARTASMRNGEIVLDGGAGAVNLAGTVDASGTAGGQGGGSITVRGGDIVNAGTLRANAGDNATAGSVNLVAAGNLTLTETSLVEARGASVNSSGGNVYLYGTGNATALAGQVIDISGGTVSGDGGSAEFSAGNHGAFAGTILGNAAEGYLRGTFLIDPVSATVNGIFAANTVVQAEDNITIDGAVTINSGIALTLLADHDDNAGSPALGVWDAAGGDGSTVGVGTITRSGAFTITAADATSTLIMAAGGNGVAGGFSIGTSTDPILTAMNGGMLSVFTNNPAQSGGGHASISNTTGTTTVNLAGVSSSTNVNNFTLVSSDTIFVGGGVTTGGNVALTASGTGSILDGGGTIAAPVVSLTAGGSIGAFGSPVFLATPSITLDAVGDAHVTSSVAIANLSLTVTPDGTRTYSVADTDATPGLNSFTVLDNGGHLQVSSLTRDGTNNVNFAVTSRAGDIQLDDNAIDAGSGTVSLTATAGSILDFNPVASDGAAAANITTTGALTLIAQGVGKSIGQDESITAGGDLDVVGVTNVTLRTNNNAFIDLDTAPTNISITADPTVGAVNYDVRFAGTLVVDMAEDGATNNLLVSSVTTPAVLDFSLTAPAGNITLADVVNGAINLSAANSDVVLTATAGAITDASAPVNSPSSIRVTDATGTLTLSAATGIGTTVNRLNTEVPQVSLTNTASGPVNLSNTGGLTVTAFSNAGGGATTIETTGGGTNALTIAANIVQSGAISLSAGESTAMADGDHLTVNSGITVQSTGGSVTLQAGDDVALGANSVIQANTTVSIAAGNVDDDTFGALSMANPSTVTAGTSASLTAVEDITVSTVSAGTTASLTTTAGSIFDDTNDTTLIDAPTGVTLSAVAGAVGADATTGDIDTDTASLTASVGSDLFVTNSNTTLSSLTLTLQPTGSATYFLDATTTGITTFMVGDSGDLDVTNVTAAPTNDLALSITNAATGSNVTVIAIDTNAGAATVSATDGTLTLQAGGSIFSGLATLSASGLLTLDGNITSTGASLTGDGVTQATASTVDAGSGDILVDATAGAVNTDGDLTTSSNNAAALRILAATGITQTLNSTISATGVGGGVITLDTGTGGAIVQDGAITNAGNAATSVSITGNGVTQAATGSIDGGAGGVLVDANNGIFNFLGSITTTSATATAVRIIDTAAATLGNITALNGTVTLGVGPLVTDADVINGDLNQNASTLIKAATLAGVVNGQTNLTNLNELSTIGTFTSLTHFELLDNNDNASAHNSGLTVTGPVTTVNGGNTTTNTANIEIRAITNANDNAGAINLFVDSITAHTAQPTQASKTGDIKLTSLNAGGTANILESPAGLGDGGIDVTGNVLSFTATNDIGQPALVGAGPIEIQGNTLNMSAGGISSVAQTGAITLGSISTDDDFSFAASGTITVGSPMVVNGDTLLQATGSASNIIVQSNITRTNDAGGTFTLEADNHIIFRNGADFVASTVTAGGSGATAVTLNSDHDAAGGGAIYLGAHSVLHSNNGSITFGGGSGAAANAIGKNEIVAAVENYDMSNGIVLEGSLSAGTGAVTLRGQSRTGASGVAGIIVRDTGVAAGVGDVVTLTAPVFINGIAVVDTDGGLADIQTSFTGSGDIATTTGNITFTGVGDQGAGNTQGVLITATNPAAGGTTLTTDSGIVNITGSHVSPATGGTNTGVLVNNGAVISSTGTAGTAGAVTLTGTGAAGDGDADNGVVITSAATSGAVRTVLSVDGAALNLVGSGGGGALGNPANGGASNVGVQILGGADVKSIGTGKVTLTGTGGATNGGGNIGIVVSGENLALSDIDKNTLVRSTSTGATTLRVDMVGVGGAGTSAGDGGVLIDSNARVRTATGDVAITGTGGAGASGGSNSDNYGVQISGGARATTSSSGSIAVTGTGGATDDGTNYGIKVTGGGVVESLLAAAGAGTITFTGTGGSGSGPSDIGIFIEGGSSLVSTTVGNVALTGTGGGGATDATDDFNYGIQVSNTAVVQTLGAAQVTLDGTGSTTSNDGSNFGVWIDLAGVVRSTGGAQTGTAGKVTIIGQGGLGTGAQDGGIGLQSGGKVTTVDAEIELQGFGGTDTTGGGFSHGVFVDGGEISTSGDGAILLTGVGGTSAGGSNHGIFTLGGALIESTTDNTLNPPAGTISLDGTAGVGAAGNNIGIAITDGSIVRSKDGVIDIFGTAAAAGASAGNVGVQVATDALITSTGLATITIDGFGSTTGTGNAYGIQLDTGAAITSTGISTITLTGVGGGTTSGGNDNYGILVTGTSAADTKVTSITGNILLTGTGGGQTASTGNIGVVISGEADIATTGAAKIDVIGLSGVTGGTNNYGVLIRSADTTVSSSGTATSDITITGTGRGTGTNAFGVLIDNSAQVLTTGAGDIAITGTGATAGTGSAVGVQMATSASVVSNTSTGKITLTGTGGSTAVSGSNNYGINLETSAQVTSVTGDILLTGTGGGTGGASASNIGVLVQSGSDVITAGAAKIDLIGLSGVTGGTNNYGVQINGIGTTVQSTSGATATGDINITGTGRGTGAIAFGVLIDNSALVLTQGAGDVTITGTGSTAGTGSADGIQIANAAAVVSDTGAGKLTLTGTGGGTAGSGSDNIGIAVLANAQITSVTGDVLLTGTGGGTGVLSNSNIGVLIQSGSDVITTGAATIGITGLSGLTTGAGNYGVYINGTGVAGATSVMSTGTTGGAITIAGTGRGSGGTEHGVLIDAGALVQSKDGNTSITGTSSATAGNANYGIRVMSDADVISTGTATLTLTGTGGLGTGTDNFGIYMGGGGTSVDSQGSGIVTLTGTGRGSGGTERGVLMDSSARVTSVSGNIGITGTSSATGSGENAGIVMASNADVVSTGTANIVLTGSGASNDNTANNHGILMMGGADVSSTQSAAGGGTILLDGNAGAGSVNNYGVRITDAGTTVLTNRGNITILGDGAVGATKGNSNIGVAIIDAAAVTSAGSGAGNIVITGAGAAGTAFNYGVWLDNGADVTSSGTGTIAVTGTAGAGTGNNNIGVQIADAGTTVTAVGGNITVNGTGGGSAATINNFGVNVETAALIETTGAATIGLTGTGGATTGGGNIGVRVDGAGTIVRSTATGSHITIVGNGGGTGNGEFGVLLNNSAQVTSAGAGNIGITGTGAVGGGNNYGIQVASNADVTSTGTGTVTLTGIAGAGSGGGNYGVSVSGGATTVSSITGNILIDGTGGGSGATADNYGVYLDAGSDIATTGAAKIDIVGRSGITSGTGNLGVRIEDSGTTVTSSGTATSDITITGTGRGTGSAAHGVQIDNLALVSTTGAGDIAITGTGSTTGTGDAQGVQVNNASIVSNTGTGKITLTGTGGGTTGSGNNNYGVNLLTNAQVTSVTGDILLDGTGGGTGATTTNIGVRIAGGSDVITTGAATIGITGLSGQTSGPFNYGVNINGAGTTVQSTATATATGDINITGTGRGTGAITFGVVVDGTAQVITQGLGDVTITGTGATAGTGSAVGIEVNNASVVSNTSTGTITLTGTGGGTAGSGDNNYGINLLNTAQVTSVTGNIQFGGTGGGAGAANGNVGVHVASNSDVASTGAATIAMTGTGGNTSGTGNHGVQATGAGTTVTSTSTAVALTGFGGGTGGDSVGVLVDSGALVGTSTGSVTLTGTGAGAGANNFGVSLAGGTVQSTSTGSLALIGTGGAGAADISAAGGGNTIGNGGMTGEILLRSLGSAGTVSDANILTSGGSGIVTLNAQGGGGFTQTGGSVVSDSLRFLGSGTFSLPDPGGANAVNKIAGTLAATSAVTYVQNGAVQVASLTSFQDGVGINQTTSNGFDIAGAGSSLSVTSGGITQTAPIVVPGTTTLTDGGNNIVLNDPNNLFGTVNVVSANNVTLGGTSIGLGNVTPSGDLTINAGTLTDSGTVIIPGTATFNVTGDMVLDSPASDFSDVTFNVAGNASLTDVNELVVNTSTVGGLLTLVTGGALNTAPGDTITAGAVTATVASGGIGTLTNNFSLDTDGDITLSVQGPAGSSPADGFVFNVGSGLLVLLPPTLLVRFNMVEFQPPTPATAALFTSANYAEQPQLDEITDLVFITDDPAEQLYPGVRRRIGRLLNGADINRDGAIRMPPGLAPSSQESGQGSEGDAPRSGRILLRE